MSEERALRAMDQAGIAYRIVRHGRVSSLAEAAAARGVEPAAIIKSIVVRRGDDDYLFVLVPGDRTISWPKLRAALGVSRLSMPDAVTAFAATGYERGTITPFGSINAWPVIADERMIRQEVSLGAGAHGVAAALSADDVVAALGATVADVTDPEPSGIVEAMSEGTITQIPVSQVASLIDSGAAFIDVREPLETSTGKAPGVDCMPMQSFNLDLVPADVPLVIICRSGARSDSVATALAAMGYTTYNVIGGMIAWEAAGLPVVADDGSVGSVF